MGIKIDTKRDPVYDNNNVWIDTKPKDVIDYAGQERTLVHIKEKEREQKKRFKRFKLC